ncbi:MAG TPA: iron-sulfur cluster repair di-iron protein [Flavipsychrobacter sp.]|nr:iron-sulfur cluster repair di-iron protein [Flavipsychrobacter sp.]
MQTAQETIINVPEIEPRLKHLTIFQTFDSLNPGESFIIHNNHDPKPVYFQLREMRGDIFTWEYLEEGPQWWDIRVTKKTFEQKLPEDAVTKNAQNETIVNVPRIEPRYKHATIFNVFDSLNAGESLIIHNDHDPKPVYYQLLNEKGDIFTWTYLQQGPEWWDIRVTIKGKDDEETVGQIAAKDLRKAEVFKKYGIDFCCGGKKTVREVCQEKGIDATKVEQELQQAAKNVTGSNMNFNEWNLDFLADYVVNTHHHYAQKYLPELRGYALKVAQVHGAHHPELMPIQQLVEEINEELTDHMTAEENVLFPMVRKIVQAKNSNAAYNQEGNASFASMVNQMEKEHDSVGRAFEEIHKLSNDLAIPEDACTTYKLFYKMIQEFEDDLHIHIHLENNILFPKTVEMEKTLA